MVSLEDIKRYLRIDYSDDDKDIENMVEVAVIWIDSMVGDSYKTDEKLQNLADLLTKKLVSDLYDNRTFTISSNAKRDYICTAILDKLSLSGYIEGEESGN